MRPQRITTDTPADPHTKLQALVPAAIERLIEDAHSRNAKLAAQARRLAKRYGITIPEKKGGKAK